MRAINYKLWGSIFLVSLLPTIYSTTRIYFLNSLSDTWSLTIAAQAAWLHLAYEVLQEATLLPLYFMFGQVIRDCESLRARVSFAFAVTLATYCALTLAVFVMADWLTAAMAQKPELHSLTSRFIRFEALAIMTGTVNDVCIVVIVALGLHRLLLILVFLRAVITVGIDALLVGQYSMSLDLGVIGVAITNIVVGVLLLVPSMLILFRLGMIGRVGRGRDRTWIHRWMVVAARAGLESAVRNLAFALMVLRLVNEVAEAGLFWVTTGFVWNWLLLPVLTLGTLLRQDAANHVGRLEGRLGGYLWLTAIIVVVWTATIPGWTWFAQNVMGSPEANRVAALALLMLAFYVVFSFNHMLDSYFYGVGRTDLMLYQSILVSTLYYGIAFLAYLHGLFEPSLTTIAMLFGGGIVIDSLVTLWQFVRAGYFRLSRAGYLAGTGVDGSSDTERDHGPNVSATARQQASRARAQG